MLTNESRGSTIEVLLTRMAALNIRVIVLSAVLRNVREVAQWLDARFVESTWRPTPLRKGVYLFTLDAKSKDKCRSTREQNRVRRWSKNRCQGRDRSRDSKLGS